MIIAFHIGNFTFRGTEVAAFDYALALKTYTKHIPIIVYPNFCNKDEEVFNNFNKHFELFSYNNAEHLNELLNFKNVDVIYFIIYGKNENISTLKTSVKKVVHCVFTCSEPHGDVYAGVSESVADTTPLNFPKKFVEHIVWLPDLKSNFRSVLGIPEKAIVFGRHGGVDTFNIPFVKNVILKILEERSDIYFLFAVKPIILEDVNHPRIIFFNRFIDKRIKRKFINTCDAMIHASLLGESFGLSVLEFAFCNKPVITWNDGQWHKQHLKNLEEKATIYFDEDSLYNILKNFKKNVETDIYTKTLKFSPENIIKKFENVFLV
jgi:glycosyltransferase involved in cell wall biosynthesis